MADWFESGTLTMVFNNFRAITQDPRNILDILIVAFVVYEVIALVRKTRAAQVAKGAVVLLVGYAVAYALELRTVTYLMNAVLQIGFLALIVLFQPELRRALEQVGRTDKWASNLFHSRRADPSLRGKWQNACLAICDAAEQLSDTSTGALIVLERGSNLSEIIRTGTAINADVNPEILGTIFYEGTPLHDGAVVVRDGTLKAAGCVLPLSDNLEIGKDMGTRHRAAIGITEENNDIFAIVVSEETGIISTVTGGKIKRYMTPETLSEQIEQAFGISTRPRKEKPKEHKFL